MCEIYSTHNNVREYREVNQMALDTSKRFQVEVVINGEADLMDSCTTKAAAKTRAEEYVKMAPMAWVRDTQAKAGETNAWRYTKSAGWWAVGEAG